jgi:hypothetical protein
MSDYPPEVVAEIVAVLEWFDKNSGAKSDDRPPEVDALYERWRDVIRGEPDFLDNWGTMTTEPGLSGFGKIFLLKHKVTSEGDQTKDKTPKGKRGRPSTIERDLAMVTEYEEGRKKGLWKGPSGYLKEKQPGEYKKDPKGTRSRFGMAQKRVREYRGED